MQRLRDLTAEIKNTSTRYTAGRLLQAKAAGKGFSSNTELFIRNQNWSDKTLLLGHLTKAAASPLDSTSMSLGPVEESFFNTLREFSIPLQLPGIRNVPLRTRFLMNSGGTGGLVVEGEPIPVTDQQWTASLALTPRTHAGILVLTEEQALVSSAAATEEIQVDLAAQVGQSENRGFLQPAISGSVLNGQTAVTTAGATLANVDVDLAALVAAVPGLAVHGNGVWVMSVGTATKLSLLRGTGGAAAFPDIGPGGGELLGLPVIVSNAAQPSDTASRFVALLDPTSIAFARGSVELDIATDASLQLNDAPVSPPDPYSAAQASRSLWQENLIAFKATRVAGWYARPSSQAYSIVGY